jgi:hypothetical protein
MATNQKAKIRVATLVPVEQSQPQPYLAVQKIRELLQLNCAILVHLNYRIQVRLFSAADFIGLQAIARQHGYTVEL